MDNQLLLDVTETDPSGEEVADYYQTTEPTVYEDGSVSLGVTLESGGALEVRFDFADLARFVATAGRETL